jgi:hypothetical protein
MAYVQNEDELNQQGKAGGTVLAGNGGSGAMSAPGQAVGTGFTNLQKYLTANQGSGSGLANDMIAQGQRAVDDKTQTANQAAISWGDEGVAAANKAGADQTAQLQGAIDYTKTGASDYVDRTADARAMKYNPTMAPPANTLDKNYSDVAEAAQLYGTDFNTQKSGLQNKYGYGNGFGALDTFLGKQDGRSQINNWQSQVTGGLKDAQGQYKGIADQQARINQANQTAASGFGELQGSLNSLVGRRKEQEDLMAQSRAAEEAAHAEALEKYKAKQAQRTQTPTYENSSGSGRGRTVVK